MVTKELSKISNDLEKLQGKLKRQDQSYTDEIASEEGKISEAEAQLKEAVANDDLTKFKELNGIIRAASDNVEFYKARKAALQEPAITDEQFQTIYDAIMKEYNSIHAEEYKKVKKAFESIEESAKTMTEAFNDASTLIHILQYDLWKNTMTDMRPHPDTIMNLHQFIAGKSQYQSFMERDGAANFWD